jgi:hypothetical protein
VEGFIAWCAFLGGWLLFAGPVYQAALELDEQHIDQEDVHAVAASVVQPPPVSAWWWLIPPVGYLLSRRRSDRYRKAVMAAMSTEQMKQFLAFVNKATGWLMVAGGALLIAAKETWILVDHYEWPVWVFWGLAVVMATLGALYTAARMSRSHRMSREA